MITPGSRFTKLVVLARAENYTRSPRTEQKQWVCRCDCGTEKTVRAAHLVSGATKSCGCLRTSARKTHGGSRKPEYRIWLGIHQRCNNMNHPEYKNYGGRGIQVDAAWSTFPAFYSDMGDRPTPKHEIDRADNNGNYAPGNCRWATRKQQCANQRNTVLLEFNGEILPRETLAVKYGRDPGTLRARLSRGWSLERALLEPPKHSSLR